MNGVVDLFHLVTDFCPNAGSVRFLRAFGMLNGTFIPDLWLPHPFQTYESHLGTLWNLFSLWVEDPTSLKLPF